MQEISFKQIIKILVPKFKLLVLLVLIGAICGGSVGAARTYSGRYFGTTIEFYVNPKRSDDATANNSQYGVYGAYGRHVMDAMIKLLASESFTEKLLLEDDGLPSLEMYPEVAGEKYTAAQEAIKAADAAWNEAKALDAERAEAFEVLYEAWNNASIPAVFSELNYKTFFNEADSRGDLLVDG